MLSLLYQQDDFPVFQNRMYDSREEAIACPKGNIRIVEDLKSGLIFNNAFSPAAMVYDGNYQNEQALSPLFQKHLESVVSKIEQHIGHDRLVEVGCGKGYFLEMLLAKGFDVVGFDPTYEGLNPRVKREYFGPGVIEKANGLILRHVLEHIQNPVDFLGQLKEANGENGKIYLEVPCLDWICEHKAWWDIFYEHVNFFRLSDFDRIFGDVVESGRLFGGQYLYVIAELSSLRIPVIDENDRVAFPPDITGYIKEHGQMNQSGAAIWGGASKGVIFALLKARAGQPVSTVIDINPAKQGRFLAGTGLQVKSPEEGLAGLPNRSTIYVMNSNYLEEIKQMSGNRFTYIGIDHA